MLSDFAHFLHTATTLRAQPVHVESDLGMLVPSNRASAFFTTTAEVGMNLAECALAEDSAA